jgi:uncharacterized repeat protein (TIGR02543 family)
MKARTKITRSIRAVSKVISVLLMIAIAVAAALIAYAWIMGYIGGTTTTTGKAIQIQSVAHPATQGSWLIIYVQNVGQSQVQLRQDASVYVNDVLHKITESPAGTQTYTGQLLPIQVGQTRELIIDYWYIPGTTLRIKVVTIEGTFMEFIIHGSETSEGSTPPGTQYTLTVDVVGSGSITKNPNKAKYNPGDSVQLIPSTNTGWQFDHWSGDLTGSANPGNIIIDSDKTVTATFIQKEYALDISITGSGTVTKSPDKATYHLGDQVQLTAAPAQSWFFAGWTGDVTSSNTQVTVTIDENPQVTATFTQTQYSLTVTVNPANGGSVDQNPLGPDYNLNDIVTLTAHPATGFTFAGWSGDLTGTANPAQITITKNNIVTANFERIPVTLTLNANPSYGGSISANQLGPYHYGDVVQLTAISNAGFSFSGWSGDLSGSANPSWITLNGNKAVTANFDQSEYALFVYIDGSGVVTKSPDKATYHLGDQVQLTAAAAQGWSFAGWTGDVTSSNTQVTVTIDENPTVTATFTQAQYSLTITANPPNGGSVDLSIPGPTYPYNTVITLTPRPATGFRFTGWEGDLTGSTSPDQITITRNMIVTADFERIPVTLTLNVNPAGKGSIIANPNSPYLYGDVVELTAAPVAGYSFSTWSGDLTGSTNPTSITLNGGKAVTANFVQKEYALDISITGSGTVTKSPDKATYHLGDQVQLTAAAAQGWSFAGWTGDVTSSNTQVTVTIDENPAVTATFTQAEYSLTVTINPSNGGSVGQNPSGPTYHYNDMVTLTPHPATGFTFSSWSGALTGTANPAQITITGNMIVTANFARIPVTLTLNVNPAGKGSINALPAGPYYYGDVVQLTAVPVAGYSFSSWSGALTGSTNPTTITLNGDKTVTANFNQNPTQVLFSTGFDGSPWAEGWNFWENPPWGRATDQYSSAPASAYCDRNNQGPFSSSPLNAQGATAIIVSFDFRIHGTDPSNFQLRYSGDPYSDYYRVHWTNLGVNLGGAPYPYDTWNHYTITITDTSAFTSTFRFQFLSQGMSTGDKIWVDNVQIVKVTG